MSAMKNVAAKTCVWAAIAVVVTGLITGCGLGTISTTGDPVANTSTQISGSVLGGEIPVTGATITLYKTNSGGTGANGTYSGGGSAATGTATVLGTTTTDSGGYFSFNASAPTCSSPDQVYLTSAGGNTGNGTNSNVLLMAAIGDCSKLTTALHIEINELTTVAAVYALWPFMTVSGNTVNVTSSATNYAGTNTSGTYTGTATNAAGLAHAFLNAATLVNITAGMANSTVPGNANTIVPVAEINTIANILLYCVNSTGGGVSGGVSDGTQCGNLFLNTTPPGTTTYPTNTLQAGINIARYPGHNVSTLFGYTPSTVTGFAPILSSAPPDFTLAVLYNTSSANGSNSSHVANATGYLFALTSDANDNIYAMDIATTYNGGNNNSACIFAVSSSGQLLSGSSGWNCTNTYVSPRQLAADQNGNIWVANNGSGAASVIEQVSATAGTLTNTFTVPTNSAYGVAVDTAGNVWANSSSSTAANNQLFKITNTSGSYAIGSALSGTASMANTFDLTIDGSGNVWSSSSTSSGFGSVYSATNANNVNSATTTSNGAYGVAIDATGHGWVPEANSTFALQQFTYTASATAPTLVAGTYVTNATFLNKPDYALFDGNNILWIADQSTPGLTAYSPSAGNFTFNGSSAPYRGCIVSAASPYTCSNALASPRVFAIDSTGSAWVTAAGGGRSNYGLVQFIGLASPTWPLLAAGKPAVLP